MRYHLLNLLRVAVRRFDAMTPLDHVHPYPSQVSDVLKRKYVIDSDQDFWNEVETLEDMLKPTSSSRGSNFLK